MSLLFRDAPRGEQRNAAPTPRDFINATTRLRQGSASRYSSDAALQVAAVQACVGLRSGAFAQLPLKGYRDRPDGTSEMVPAELLRSPSDAVVPSVWKIQMSISRDLWGFALGRITAFDAAFYPKRAEWIDPSLIGYQVVGGQVEWRIENEFVDRSLLIHVPSRWVMPGNPVGMSPLEKVGLVELAQRAQDFGRDWFRNGAVPSSIIYSDDPNTTSEQADGIIDRLASRWRSRQPGFLGSGLRYEKISVPANESQFLETKTHAAAEIAVAFNLPPSKIGAAISGQSVTYSNRDQDQMAYLIDSINPDLVVIEESLDRHSPRGQYCKFKTGGFLKSDLKTRYESYNLGIQGKFLTPNEARAWEELPPLDGGDVVSQPAPQVAPPAPEPVAPRMAEPVEVRTVQPIEHRAGDTHIHLPESLQVEMRQEPIIIPAPIVNVPAPEVTVNVEPVVVPAPEVVVNVAPAEVTVNPAITVSAPDVTVSMPDKGGNTETITFERDGQGRIIGATKVES